MKNIFMLIFAFTWICTNAPAQEKNVDNRGENGLPGLPTDEPIVFTEEKSSKELKGDKYFFNYSFEKAIRSYTRTGKITTEGQRRLAESYQKHGLYVRSEEASLKLVNFPKGVIAEDYYNYAMALKANGKYDEANVWMEKFRTQKQYDLRVTDYVSNKNMLGYLLKDDGKYKIRTLNVNTDAEEFGTSYYNNSVVFASSRSGSGIGGRKYNWTGKPYWDIYISEVNDGQLNSPELFGKNMRGKVHEGPASFSNNGNFMAFTRNNSHDKTKDRVVELQILFSTYKDEKWSVPEPFILNSKDYSIGHPCLTSDGNTMYFTSDMPGGYGGADIYRISRNEKGVWGIHENLGNQINTEGDELFPFFEETNSILFFSSNGRFGLGGLDIFMCTLTNTGPGHVYNAGVPLNSQYDDFAAIVNSNLTKGYFSSDRTDGVGGDDIYAFDILKNLGVGNETKPLVADTLSNPDVLFSVFAPKNIPVKRRVRETFPIRNYIFFNLESTEIPDRYVLLTKDQVKEFKESQLEVFTPKKLSGRSKRQLIAYYNILNILGDRMNKNPESSITLVGSSEKGPEDGKIMAESVKLYLVTIFGIDPSRISIEGRLKPKIPSEKPDFTRELDLLRECDRRVTIESNSPVLLMEFQSGSEAPLKPVEITEDLEAPLDSYVSFTVAGSEEVFTTWSLEVTDESGAVQSFGPYDEEKVCLPGKTILGSRAMGDYKVKMTGNTLNGGTITKETNVHLVLWTPSEREEAMRFSIIYEFNESKAIKIYEKYLTEIVIPKIPIGSLVIVSGYTDVIGVETHNQKLSLARANDAKTILENGLAKAGRTDVTFEVYGFGENNEFSPFENGLPEERFYNRTVVIDIIPQE
jgi:outer membrane protein OmpA-like peptidoglycan-associated protein